MYEVVIAIIKGKEVVKVRAFVEADSLDRAAKLADQEVREKTKYPSEAISAKQADGPVVLMASGEKAKWLHAEDMRQAPGQTSLPEK